MARISDPKKKVSLKPKTAPKRPAALATVDIKKLQSIAASVKKIMGKQGTGVVLPDSADLDKMEFVSTGLQALDDAISAKMDPDDGSKYIAGTGRGFPRGRIIEIYGPEAGSKTTLALLAIAWAQRNGLTTGFVDAEHALSFPNAKTLGVNCEGMLYDDPETAEEALLKTRALIESGCDVVVYDSVASVPPEQEQEIKNGKPKTTPGKQAALMSLHLRALAPLVARKNALLIFINQTRQKIGVMFGNPETTQGGNALRFYASVRIRVVKIQALRKAKRKAGVRIKAVVQKNKIAPPFREVVFDIVFGKGVSVADVDTSEDDEPEGEDERDE